MPVTPVVFFQFAEGEVPALESIRVWRRRDPRIAAKALDRIRILGELGHEMRRPLADHLRDGVYELRTSFGHVHYRLLYFFSNQKAVLACGIVKEGEVPDAALEMSIRYRSMYEKDADRHTYVRQENQGV